MSSSRLTLNFTEGSVSFHFTPEAARELKATLVQLTERLKAVATHPTGGGERPTPQKPIEYQYTGEVFLEVFCNPNIWATPFSAKILLTLRDERLRISTEVELTRAIEDVERYLEQLG